MTSQTIQVRPATTIPADEPSLNDLLHKLWFNRRLLFSTAFLIIAVGLIMVFQLQPRYTAISSMMIGVPQTYKVYIEQVMNGGFDDGSGFSSEIEVLRSRELAGRLIETFDLTSKEEFNPSLRSPDLLAYLTTPALWIPEGWRKSLGFGSDGSVLGEKELKERERKIIVTATNIFLSKLQLSRISNSHVVNISFESLDPLLAAAIANELPESYIIGQLDAKLEAISKATGWLNDQLTELKEKVENSENAVETYREEHGLTEVQGSRLLSSHFANVNQQLIEAKAAHAQAKARIEQIRVLQSRGDTDIESSKEVMSSSVIQRLQSQEDALASKVSTLSVQYGPKHIKMKTIIIELDAVRKEIKNEIKRIVVGLENEVEVARIKEESLSKSLKELEKQSVQQTKESIRLHTLEREAASNRVFFETFLNRFKETSSTAGIQEPEGRVISRAEIPAKPSYPNLRKMIIMIIAVAFFIAISLVLLLQALRQGLMTPEEIEKELGLSVIGVIPEVPEHSIPHDYILEKPHSRFSEALNTMKTSMVLSSPDHDLKVMQFTSSVPAEGKSTLAISYARLLAKSGNKVVLVDGDLRLGSLEEKLGISGDRKGLTDLVMSSDGLIEDFVTRDDASGADIMTKGGAEYVNTTDVFSSHRMKEIIESLKNAYDYIIIDSPPVMVVSDARIIGNLVDKSIFVVQWEKTPRKVIKIAVQKLLESSSELSGCVLNRIDLQRYGKYSGGDSGYYYHYGRYGDYYTN